MMYGMFLFGVLVALVSCFWWFWKRNSAVAVVPKTDRRRQSEERGSLPQVHDELDLSHVSSLAYSDFVTGLLESGYSSEQASDDFDMDDIEDRSEPSLDLTLWATVIERTLTFENAVPNIDENRVESEERDRHAIERSF